MCRILSMTGYSDCHVLCSSYIVLSGVNVCCMQASHCCTADVDGQWQTAVCSALFGSLLFCVIPVQKWPRTVSGYTDTSAVLHWRYASQWLLIVLYIPIILKLWRYFNWQPEADWVYQDIQKYCKRWNKKENGCLAVHWHCWFGISPNSIQPAKVEWCGTGMVICLERDANVPDDATASLSSLTALKPRTVYLFGVTWTTFLGSVDECYKNKTDNFILYIY